MRCRASQARIAAALAGMLVVVTSGEAWAQRARKPAKKAEATTPAEPPPEMPAAVDPALAEAQQLYSQGLTHYETFDYDLAIASWKDALERLRSAEIDTSDKLSAVTAARTAIVYNIASAQQRAFEQDHDVARLKKAKGLLELYMRELQAAGAGDAAELSVAQQRIDEISAQIQLAEELAEQPDPVAPPPSTPPAEDGPMPGRGLIGGGAALLVVGIGTVVGGAVAGTRLSSNAESDLAKLDELGDEGRRRDALDRGKTGDALLIGCTVAGGVAAIAGTVMLAIGARRASASRRGVTAMWGPGQLGIVLTGRF